MKNWILYAALGFTGMLNAANWHVVNHDQHNTRYNPEETILSPTTVGGLEFIGSFPTPNGDQVSPIIVDNVLYTGDVSGNLYAFTADLPGSSPIWQIALPGPIDGPPGYFDGVLYVTTGTGDLKIYALNAVDGTPLSTWPVGGVLIDPTIPLDESDVLVGPVVVDNIVIVTLVDGGSFGVNPSPTVHQTINAYNATDGSFLWRRVIQPLPWGPQGGGFSTAAVDPKLHMMFVGTSNSDNKPVSKFSDALLALDYRTGELIWSYQFTKDDAWGPLYPNDPDQDVGASPNLFTIKNKKCKKVDVVGVSSKRGIYRVFERKTGKQIWHTNTVPDGFNSVSTAAPGSAYDPVLHQIYVPVLLLDTPTWLVQPPLSLTILQSNGNAEAIAILGNLNYYVMRGQIVALDADTGRINWRYSTPGVFSGSPAAANGVVYFNNWRGEIYALSGKTGSVLWENSTQFPTIPTYLTGPMVVANGLLYLTLGLNFGVPIPGGVYVFGLP